MVPEGEGKKTDKEGEWVGRVLETLRVFHFRGNASTQPPPSAWTTPGILSPFLPPSLPFAYSSFLDCLSLDPNLSFSWWMLWTERVPPLPPTQRSDLHAPGNQISETPQRLPKGGFRVGQGDGGDRGVVHVGKTGRLRDQRLEELVHHVGGGGDGQSLGDKERGRGREVSKRGTAGER
jgi:hypothetical protein